MANDLKNGSGCRSFSNTGGKVKKKFFAVDFYSLPLFSPNFRLIFNRAMKVQFYGIRHHGPGSARSLLAALEAQAPDCILIEHPADGGDALPQLAENGLEPPVALLVFDPKDGSRAHYYPFAVFSPEYQAARFAVNHSIPIKAMDLPAGRQFWLEALSPAERMAALPGLDDTGAPLHDPLGHIAALAGYSDSERWWEVALEREAHGSGVFDLIREMMGALRMETGYQPSPETLLREAFMRQTLRETAAQGFGNIAVVCGAWHVPALTPWETIKAADDKRLLKGLKSVKIQWAWIPWTYERLALESGYRAGVLSPAWYELLFRHPSDSSLRWMVEAARLMRSEDMEVSTAAVVDAVRLAEAVAALRGHAVPGIEDMEQAAAAVLTPGSEAAFALIRRKAVLGDLMGKVPASLPAPPLWDDLEKTIKSVRLSKEFQSSEPILKELDLRLDAPLRASQLLHRLLLLEVPWGELLPTPDTALGTFRESWRLKWLPDYTLRLVKAGAWGNSIETAASRYLLHRTRQTGNLPELTALAYAALHANLPDAVHVLMENLENAAALATDVHILMDTLPGLARIARYGNVRQTDRAVVQKLIAHLVPRIALGLPAACQQLDDEPAEELFRKLWDTHRQVLLLEEAALSQLWEQAMTRLESIPSGHPLLRGAALRILFDRKVRSEDEAADRFSLELSAGSNPLDAARWIEGFLYGSGLLLIHYPPLWRLLDDWLQGLSPEAFRQALPLLRRAFSAFSGPERQKMLQLAARNTPTESIGEWPGLDPQRVAVLEPVMALLLGMSEGEGD